MTFLKFSWFFRTFAHVVACVYIFAMASPLVGSVGEFDSSTETFTAYCERLEQYFVANNIGEYPADATAAVIAAANKKKVAVTISVIGKKIYGTLRDLCSPENPKDKTFAALCELLQQHFKPKRLEVAESYRFHRCFQEENESVSVYSARLRHLASTCNFGEFLNRSLRDQFVCGIRYPATRKKLLSQDRTFQEALQVAIADEIAAKESVQVQQQLPQPVNSVAKDSPKLPFSFRANPRVPPTSRQAAGQTSTPNSSQQPTSYTCFSCGNSDHTRPKCKFRNAVCRNCNLRGHIARVCKKNRVNAMCVEEEFMDEQLPEEEELFVVYDVNAMSKSEISVPLKIENNDCFMQLDTGCALSLAPIGFFKEVCPDVKMKPTNVVLSTYTGETVHPLGEAYVDVEYSGSRHSLPLLIVQGGSCALFGRNWLMDVKLDWKNLPGLNLIGPLLPSDATMPASSGNQTLDFVLEQYNELFQTQLGCYTGKPVVLNESKEAKFHKARPVPYALQSKVESTLLKMEKDGVIERVTSAVSAAPIVVVGKKESDEVRLCGDFSVTYNACANVETYPMPQIEDMHSALRGCTVFSVLDMKQAYHQIPIAKESQPYLTVNTHIGLFAFKRLPNGIHSGPAIFQRIMDNLLSDIPKAVCRLDDILVAGTDHEDHLRTLSLVLERLLTAGFRLNKTKCKFLQPSVVYLGHKIDGEGLHPTEDKLTAIRDAPRPKDVTALKSFLGLLMFYSRFMPHHSTVLAPLHSLLKKDTPWKWSKVEEDTFVAAKQLILDSQTLVHYDDMRPLFLSCDASSYGAGAVLSHQIDGQFRPVAFASCTLTQAQRNYSQLEKEAFSIIFGLKRFRQYLYGRSFTILTDHRPLLTLLGPHHPVPAHAAARLQRWALILASYDYKIEYRSTTAHADADSMSRLPLPQTWSPKCENIECYFLEPEVVTNVTSEMIKKATQVDPVLSKVYSSVISGWPGIVDPTLVPFKSKRDELSTQQGCVLWGTRVVVPSLLQEKVLQELHETHPGISRMKALARSYVWWPNIDSHIERTVSSCNTCQSMRSAPPTAQIHPWIFPARPWSRIHVDFAGPISGCTYMVVVDAYSKFPEVVKMTNITARTTITALRDIFSRHGLPEILVSDNGAQFTAREFEQFCANNGILHRTSAAYKPSTNGQAERVVQILKSAIKQAQLTNTDVTAVIAKYLLVYRNTPHSTTGEPPSLLLMGRRLRTRLDLLIPSVEKHVEARQYSTMVSRTAKRGLRQFNAGDTVLARNYGRGEKWMRGVITEVLGSRHYMIEVSGNLWKRHVDQLLRRPVDVVAPANPSVTEDHPMPLEMASNVDRSGETVPDSTTPCTSAPPTATLDESHLTDSREHSCPESPLPRVPLPVTDIDTTLIVNPSSLLDIPESANIDDALLVHPNSACEIPTSTCTEKRYPTRSTRGPPSYLKDYKS